VNRNFYLSYTALKFQGVPHRKAARKKKNVGSLSNVEALRQQLLTDLLESGKEEEDKKPRKENRKNPSK